MRVLLTVNAAGKSKYSHVFRAVKIDLLYILGGSRSDLRSKSILESFSEGLIKKSGVIDFADIEKSYGISVNQDSAADFAERVRIRSPGKLQTN